MHKYVVRVHIVQANDLLELQYAPYNTFTFLETTFLGVTAYQVSLENLILLFAVSNKMQYPFLE